jgi:hypothetical protein
MSIAATKRARQSSAGKQSTGKSNAAPRNDFAQVFSALRAILECYEGRLAAKSNRPDYYYLETHGPTYRNRPMYFAAARVGKACVSYHLMPVYACPELKQSISPELRKRMQGKACFNFRKVESRLFEELARLTAEGFEKFRNLRYLR